MFALLAQVVFVGNPVCETCHRGVSQHFAQTPMARSFKTGQWQIGSGQHTRILLDRRDGFFYPRGSSTPLDTECFDCHSSVPKRIAATIGKLGDPPFLQNGVACERCHGPGGLHVSGSGRMVFPTALDPAERDAICAQCHLMGAARVPRTGRDPALFLPGDRWSDYVTVFAAEGPPAGPVEQLAASRCKQKSPDLWCGTCHDVHQSKTDRSACQQCHTPKQCNRGTDCVSCHMPKSRGLYTLHQNLTDHTISKTPQTPRAVNGYRLRPLTELDRSSNLKPVNRRDLGVAYAVSWQRTGDKRQLDEAGQILTRIPNPDPVVQAWLGRIAQLKGDNARAVRLFEAALARQPNRMALEQLPQLYRVLAGSREPGLRRNAPLLSRGSER